MTMKATWVLGHSGIGANRVACTSEDWDSQDTGTSRNVTGEGVRSLGFLRTICWVGEKVQGKVAKTMQAGVFC